MNENNQQSLVNDNKLNTIVNETNNEQEYTKLGAAYRNLSADELNKVTGGNTILEVGGNNFNYSGGIIECGEVRNSDPILCRDGLPHDDLGGFYQYASRYNEKRQTEWHVSCSRCGMDYWKVYID